MEVSYILGVLKKLWDYWDVRGFMLLSFALQTFLFFLAPFRCSISSYKFISTIFCLYLLADWAANYAAGVISSGLSDNRKNEESLAFWCSFLLVHLGGPDSITAFALQDNDFWHRHALAIVFQCISSIYIFIQTCHRNPFKIPTVLVFISGVIRYGERTRSLYCASVVNLRDSLRKKPDPGSSYSKATNVYRSLSLANLPTRIEMVDVPRREIKVKRGRLSRGEVKMYAYQFFEMVKRLAVDLKCSDFDRRRSREFFLARTAEDAFNIVATELSFLYQTLFTKAIFLYTASGVCLRSISFALMVASLGVFYSEVKEFSPSDVAISYTLLLGAIASDVISFIFHIFCSDFVYSLIRKLPDENWLIPGPATVENDEKSKRKWSESVGTLGLIGFCLSPRRPEFQRTIDSFGLASYFDRLGYVKSKLITPSLRKLIFDEVMMKSLVGGDDLESASSARDSWVLHLDPDLVQEYIIDMDYDKSLLLWHIATELCWHAADDDEGAKINNYREHAKLLSDYMMYLVKMQPAIMYGVTDIGQTRLRDTCAEIKRESSQSDEKEPNLVVLVKSICCTFVQGIICFIFWIFSPAVFIILSLFEVVVAPMVNPLTKYQELKRHGYDKLKKNKWSSPLLQCFYGEAEKAVEDRVKEFCEKILQVNTEVEAECIRGDKSKSVLFDGCLLAKKLMELDRDKQWEMMSKVWVEILSRAAVRCRPQTLAQQLSRGGELISSVWLLMAHFGLVDHFDDVRISRAKLVVEK